jgi:Zn-dependent peptidase ImmA (M78 family)
MGSLYERARCLARDVLRECGADEPSKIDPFAIVGRRGIAVKYGGLEGATARVFHMNGRAVMRISDSIVQDGRRFFTVAHETGHVLLGHKLPSESDINADSRAPFYSQRQEREADAFAAEHNTPAEWVRPYCNGPQKHLDAVRAIANDFPCTIVSAALRYVELSSNSCAVAYSERGCVKWAKGSRTFPGRIPTQMRIGRGSIAAEYHKQGVLDTCARLMSPRVWLGSMTRVADTLTMIEHAEVVPEPGWGGVLSLLWLTNVE